MLDSNILDFPEVYSELLAKTAELNFSMPSDVYIGTLLKTLISSKPDGHFLELGTGMGLSLSWMLEGLNEDQRYWFAKTVVAMVMVDEHIEIHERAFLHSALRLLTNNHRVQELEEAILLGKIPDIDPIKLTGDNPKRILESLINVATIDRDFDQREEKLFRQIGDALDIDDKFINSTIKLGHTRVQQFRANQLRAPNVRARI